MKKTVVLGISSGIAAYKTLELVKELKKENCEVFVVMTKSATRMVDLKEFEKASENKVYTDLFEENFDYKNILKARKVDHIDLADRADVICIAPATANIIAKLAHGIADDFLTTMILAANSPIILSPSMNVHMWTNPATQKNIDILRKRGFTILPPEKGPLACGYEGPGRLPHILTIKDEIFRHISYSKSLAGKTVVMTAGATKEKIDDVRFITNNASGKMGIALADECYLRGAKVVLLRAKGSVEPRYMYQQELFETVEELQALIATYVKDADLFFHTAAVGDFGVENSSQGKTTSKKKMTLTLIPQQKLSDEIKKINSKTKLIVFKAEWGVSEDKLVYRAREKLADSHADMVVANDIGKRGRGFESDVNEVILVTKTKEAHVPLASKKEIAKTIVTTLLSS